MRVNRWSVLLKADMYLNCELHRSEMCNTKPRCLAHLSTADTDAYDTIDTRMMIV